LYQATERGSLGKQTSDEGKCQIGGLEDEDVGGRQFGLIADGPREGKLCKGSFEVWKTRGEEGPWGNLVGGNASQEGCFLVSEKAGGSSDWIFLGFEKWRFPGGHARRYEYSRKRRTLSIREGTRAFWGLQ